ncbi:unnamed protein product [Protopolystoma xenopodis]|uniref:PIPK domain-containing protein n=1 Tax=Protopolystoma xenopodis TaxID=117903 RepID=A0A3S4ZXQ1_9PLAT|nr:unnamed protein product [Protopolystoma xenopodis]
MFLQNNNLMDYSLLIGIHDTELGTNAAEVSSSSDEAGGPADSACSGNRAQNTLGLEPLASAGDGLGNIYGASSNGRCLKKQSSQHTSSRSAVLASSQSKSGIEVGTDDAEFVEDEELGMSDGGACSSGPGKF